MTDIARIAEGPRTPVIVHCADCQHEWTAFYLPLALDAKGIRLMRSAAKACPMCAKSNVMMGHAKNLEAMAVAARSNEERKDG